MRKKIGVIGCGNMGEAIIKAVLCSKFQVLSFDLDKRRVRYIAKKYKVKAVSSNSDLAKKSDIIILAVKPKDIKKVIHQIKDELNASKCLISIAAGIRTSFIEKITGRGISVIRVMPNMPALVRAGISAVCKGRFATNKDLAMAKKLLKNIGEVVEVKESLMDAVTAISGSGPAYFFYLVEVLITIGVELGLTRETAKKLAIETAVGSAKVLKETKEEAGTLRARVTSKGGTTEAAFKEFLKGGLEMVLKKGIKKAFERAKCL